MWVDNPRKICFTVFAALRFALSNCAAASRLNKHMAWTHYYSPNSIQYFAEDGTGWVDTQGGLSTHRNIIMVDQLIGVATSTGRINASDSRALLLTNFGIPVTAGTLVGIEVVTEIDRVNRVLDQTVQLAFGGQLIGENRASSVYDNNQSYGGATDLWGTEGVNYSDASFGLVLDLRPDFRMPSNERPILRELRMRLYFN
jgi:hypothetical protein